MTNSDATDSLATVAPAALALPATSRAVLADLLLSSLETGADRAAGSGDADEFSADELAQRLTADFHEAKKAALGTWVDSQGPWPVAPLNPAGRIG